MDWLSTHQLHRADGLTLNPSAPQSWWIDSESHQLCSDRRSLELMDWLWVPSALLQPKVTWADWLTLSPVSSAATKGRWSWWIDYQPVSSTELMDWLSTCQLRCDQRSLELMDWLSTDQFLCDRRFRSWWIDSQPVSSVATEGH